MSLKAVTYLLIAFALTIQAQTATLLYGTWRFNPSKSSYSVAPPFMRATCIIEPWNDGLKVSYDMVGTRGGRAHWEWTGRLDGKDYPLQGIDDVVTNAYSRIDDHTYQSVSKIDGQTTTITRIKISTDGKTMTASNTLIDSRGNETQGTT